jgi:hypothetical protein
MRQKTFVCLNNINPLEIICYGGRGRPAPTLRSKYKGSKEENDGRIGGVVQVVEYLLFKCEVLKALSSNSSPTKTNKNQKMMSNHW